jgi:hypothetical protein
MLMPGPSIFDEPYPKERPGWDPILLTNPTNALNFQ